MLFGSRALKLARCLKSRSRFLAVAAALLQVTFLAPIAFGQRPLGTDVSGYQPASVDWTSATNGGVKFAWSKATEGTGYTNQNFASQVAGAVAAKVYIGAYHYARPGLHPNLTGVNSADSEAAYFWSVAGTYLKNGGKYLMPMLDWEDVGTSGQPSTAPAKTNGFTAAGMSAWVNEWCNSLSNTAYASGVIVNPVVYSGSWYSSPGTIWPGLDSSVTFRPNNMSGYPANPNPQTGSPSSTAPWPSWTFWQYADTNWTGGDSDVYNGTLATLIQKFVIGGTNAPSITAGPTNVFVEAGSPGTFRVTATGSSPLRYQWAHNGANISGATTNVYAIAAAHSADVGAYTVVLSNSYALVTSTVAYLTILSNVSGAIPAPSGLVDWWPADGAAADLLTTYSGSPVGGVTYVAGKRGSAFHFDGATSYLVTGAPSLSVPWTACMWVKREQTSSTASAMMGDGLRELKLEQYSNTFNVGFTIFGVADYKWSYTAPAGTWTHLAYVASGTQMQLYANGSLIGTITTNCPCPRGWIGASYVTSSARIVDYMKGALDEVQIFNRALSSTEIGSIYSAGSAGLTQLPVFTGNSFATATQFRLTIQGLTSRSVSIWRSPGFGSWTKLTTLSNPNGTVTYTDTQATNPMLFYRATQP